MSIFFSEASFQCSKTSLEFIGLQPSLLGKLFHHLELFPAHQIHFGDEPVRLRAHEAFGLIADALRDAESARHQPGKIIEYRALGGGHGPNLRTQTAPRNATKAKGFGRRAGLGYALTARGEPCSKR